MRDEFGAEQGDALYGKGEGEVPLIGEEMNVIPHKSQNIRHAQVKRKHKRTKKIRNYCNRAPYTEKQPFPGRDLGRVDFQPNVCGDGTAEDPSADDAKEEKGRRGNQKNGTEAFKVIF